MDWARNAVKANASVVRLLVPAHTTTNVTVASITVIANASVVRLLVPARTTTNVDRERNAVKANASEVRPLVIVRPTTSLILEGIVVGEFVPHTVVGAAQLLQMLFSARLSSSLSSFPSSPAAVFLARTTAVVHPVLWS